MKKKKKKCYVLIDMDEQEMLFSQSLIVYLHYPQNV